MIDGTEYAAPRMADVAVRGDRIVRVQPDIDCSQAAEVIDARGSLVTPGFIDTHSHADLALLAEPAHREKVTQGVTAEILGQDGISYAPLSPENLRQYRRYNAGLNGDPDLPWEWTSVAEYRRLYHRRGAVNTAHLIGHGPIRLEAAGMEDVPLTGKRLDRALGLLEQGLQAGAVGFSTGLSYFPHFWADTQELVDLCEVVQEYGAVFVIHLRTVFRGERFDPVQEALQVARRTGVKLHFSHFRTGPRSAGKVDEKLAQLDEAHQDGVDLSLDLYPYPQGASLLLMLLPPWANEGGPEKLLERLSDPEVCREMAGEIEAPGRAGSWDEMVLSNVPSAGNCGLVGMTVAEVARQWGLSPQLTVCRLLSEEELAVGFWIAPPDEETCHQLARDQLQILSRPYAMVGSDSIHVGDHPHPRAFGTFPRFIGRYRRRYGGMTLPEMVHRMTSAAADRFNLAGRGRIAVDEFADIVVFDPDEIVDRASYQQPKRTSTGIECVIINGVVVMENRCTTDQTPGYAVPRP